MFRFNGPFYFVLSYVHIGGLELGFSATYPGRNILAENFLPGYEVEVEKFLDIKLRTRE
jgi:hypothetical protein